jgi:hypothetical protein
MRLPFRREAVHLTSGPLARTGGEIRRPVRSYHILIVQVRTGPGYAAKGVRDEVARRGIADHVGARSDQQAGGDQ